ncbi:MAG: hypothetical protein NVSMB27_21050 [Ktedonobacteraceae bacterium]
MSEPDPQQYLLTKQYKNAANLNARIALHRRFSTNKYEFQRWVFDQFSIPAGGRILELGCGPGQLWLKNANRIPEKWDITLSDFSPGMLQEAQQNLESIGRHFTFQRIDAQSIPYGNESFDVVIANHMLYHVPDRKKAFSEISRVLRSEGRLYAVTNGQKHMEEVNELVHNFDAHLDHSWKKALLITLPFRLENGSEELSPWFSQIRLFRYEDALIVTEAEPLVAYVLSTNVVALFDEEKIRQFTKFVQRKLDAQGAIHITKNTGLFEALK